MSISTDWDINYYRTDYESDEHWALRKAFMETHKEKFAENELVCLAQVFANVELLGCKYPDKTMQKVALLSKEVADEYRKSRENRIKRTFVAASDAAGAKVKGRNAKTTKSSTNTQISFIKSSTEEEHKTIVHSTENKTIIKQESTSIKKISSQTITPQSSQTSNQNHQAIGESNPRKRKFESFHSIVPCAKSSEPKKRLINTEFIIYETINKAQQSIHILQMSASKQGANFRCDLELDKKTNQPTFTVYINNTPYGSAPVTATTNKKDAKLEACNKALEYARKINYTIKQKETNKTVSVAFREEDKLTTETTTCEKDDGKLSENNKGFKMLKMLGWTGGALGTDGTGIQEPINIELKVDRKGLGLPTAESSDGNSKINNDFFTDYLKNYRDDINAIYDLVFSKEFNKEERKSLHEISNRLGLKSRSRNDADGRYLVVSKKINLVHLATDILNNGLYAEFYELLSPTEPLPPAKTSSKFAKQSNKPNYSTQSNNNKKKKFHEMNRSQRFSRGITNFKPI